MNQNKILSPTELEYRIALNSPMVPIDDPELLVAIWRAMSNAPMTVDLYLQGIAVGMQVMQGRQDALKKRMDESINELCKRVGLQVGTGTK